MDLYTVDGPSTIGYQPVVNYNVPSPTVMAAGSAVGPDRTRLICPHCKESVLTRIEHRSNSQTHRNALLLCVFSCWLCMCLPYCCNSCRDAVHTCPNCDAFIGSYHR